MADTTYSNDAYYVDEEEPFRADEPTAAARKLRYSNTRTKRFLRWSFEKVTSKKAQDMAIGAAVSGSVSLATRLSVIGAAGTLGVSVAPAAILAAAVAGTATGATRYYLEYRKEKAAGTWTGFQGSELRKHLLRGTIFSALGGTGSYLAFHVYNEQIADFATKVANPVVERLRDAGVFDAVASYTQTVGKAAASAYEGAKDLGTKALNLAFPDQHVPEGIAVKIEQATALTASVVAAAPGFFKDAFTEGKTALASVSAPAFESLKEKGGQLWGWTKSFFPSPEQPTAIADNTTVIQKTPGMAGVQHVEKIELAQEKGWDAKGNRLDVVQTADTQMSYEDVTRKVKTFVVKPDGTMTPYVAPVVTDFQPLPAISSEEIAAQFDRAEKLARVTDIFKERVYLPLPAEVPADVPSLATQFTTFDQRFDMASLPKYDANAPITIYSEEVSPEMTAGIEPKADAASAVADIIPAKQSFGEQFGDYFKDADVSKKTQRLIAAAMDGNVQSQKDLSMMVGNGLKGFDKDPVLAGKILDNILANADPNARPDRALMQVMRDKAYKMFTGDGYPVDKEGAKALLEPIADRSKVARAMLREWAGEKVEKVAAVAKKTVQHAVSEEKIEKVVAGTKKVAKAVVDTDTVASVKEGGTKLASFFGGKVNCPKVVEVADGPTIFKGCTGPRNLVEKVLSGKVTLDMK